MEAIGGSQHRLGESEGRSERPAGLKRARGVGSFAMTSSTRDTENGRLPADPLAVPRFDDFYRDGFADVAVLAGAILGDRTSGEDVAQEAFTRLHGRWTKVGAYDNPNAWVRRVAVNLAISRRRRIATEARALLRLGPPPAIEQRRHGNPAVWAAVAGLPPRQRAVIALHYLEDRPVVEIAEILDCSVSAATSNLYKARRSLAQTLDSIRELNR